MRRCLHEAAAAIALTAAGGASAHSAQARMDPSPQVRVDAGVLTGAARADGGAQFRAIPYAAPPVGALRWRPPQPIAPWRGAREATTRAPACPQTDYGSWNAADARNGREDCLYLDVTTPRLDPRARLPVMVWIHGGGNRGGSMGDTIHSALATRGVVLVAIQYRLAALGFMAHPALSAEQGGRSGNYGLMDQVAALRWVRANIARFGGDPANVTILGESAGAQDVGLLMLEPAARGLFAKAIEQSGTAGFGVPARNLGASEAVGAAIAARAGAPPRASAAALRALPVSALLSAPEAMTFPTVADPSFVWLQAQVDGRVLLEPPRHTIEAGRQARVPLLIGTNARELPLYGAVNPAATRIFGAHAPAALRTYRADLERDGPGGGLLGAVANRIATDATFRCPALKVARAQARLGAPTWLYRFDRRGADGRAPTHGSDLSPLFGGENVSAAGGPAVTLGGYWTRFAATGDPNGGGAPAWPKLKAGSPRRLDFTKAGPSAMDAITPGDPCAFLPEV